MGLVKQGWEWVGPGGKLHPEEFLERFHGHLVIEALLAIVIGYLFFQQSFKWSMRKNPKLLSEEVSFSSPLHLAPQGNCIKWWAFRVQFTAQITPSSSNQDCNQAMYSIFASPVWGCQSILKTTGVLLDGKCQELHMPPPPCFYIQDTMYPPFVLYPGGGMGGGGNGREQWPMC